MLLTAFPLFLIVKENRIGILLPVNLPAIYRDGDLPKCRSLLTISDGSSCSRTEMLMLPLLVDPERAQFHIQRAADWANNRVGIWPVAAGGCTCGGGMCSGLSTAGLRGRFR